MLIYIRIPKLPPPENEKHISRLWTLLLRMNFASGKRNNLKGKTGERERKKQASPYRRSRLETEDVVFPVQSLASCLIFYHQ